MSEGVAPTAIDTAHGLFAKLRVVFGRFGIKNFAIYTVEEGEASLAFSSGAASPIEATPDGKIVVDDYASLSQLLAGDTAYLVDPAAAPFASAIRSALDLPGATAAFRMPGGGRPLGFVLIYGSVPRKTLQPESLQELTTLVTFFSDTFARRRRTDLVNRDFARTQSKLHELQEGLNVLVETDRAHMLDTILRRALGILGSRRGMIWLKNGDRFEEAYVVGEVPSTEDADLASLVQRSCATNKAALVSSLSGEETWDFDVETIHMASFAVFPLSRGDQCIGTIVAIDATVSLDSVNTIEGTAMVGAVAIENLLNSQRMLEQQRLKEQLALAAKTQQRLLPARRERFQGLSVAYFSHYCDDAGGDYVDTISSREPYLCTFVVGDVSGHGVGAAMLMVDVRARLRTFVETRALWSPADLLTATNSVLCQESAPEEFVTLFLCALDSRTGVMRYASAGHEPPLVFHARQGTWSSLPSTGLPLGMVEEASYTVERATLEPGDRIIFITDGATEMEDTDGVPFGTDRIKEVVEEHRDADAETLLDRVVKRTLAYCEGQAFVDDITYMVLNVDRVTLRVMKEAPTREGTIFHEAIFSCTTQNRDQQLVIVRDKLAGLYEDRILSDVIMPFEEALTNAIDHGNKQDPNQQIALQILTSEDAISVVIEHDGKPFDPRQFIPDAIDANVIRRERGRGLLIMASMMDEVTYWNEGRGVMMVKRAATPLSA